MYPDFFDCGTRGRGHKLFSDHTLISFQKIPNFYTLKYFMYRNVLLSSKN